MKGNVLLVACAQEPGLGARLRRSGYLVDAAADGRQATQRAQECRPDVAIIDLALAGPPDGVDTAMAISRLGIPIIYLGDAEEALLHRAAAIAPVGYIVPPVHAKQLDLTMRAALAADGSSRKPPDSPLFELERGGIRVTESIFNDVSDGIVITDLDGNIRFVNTSAVQILGPRGAADVDWRETLEFFEADATTPIPATETPALFAGRGESKDKVVFCRYRGEDEGAYVSVHSRPVHGADGPVVGVVTLVRDITESQRAEQDLREANRRLHEHEQTLNSVFESIGDGVLVLDTDANVILASQSVHRMVGDGMLARTDPSRWRTGHGIFLPDEETRIPLEDMPHVRAIADQSSTDYKVFIRNPKIPNGIHLSLDCQPMRDPSGNIRGAVLVARDETPQRRAQQALTNAFAHGRLEVLDTVVHNIGNAINSVEIGLGTVQDLVRDNVLVRRLAALARTVEPHVDDWEAFLTEDRRGRQVLPFLLALAKDFERQNAQLARTVERVSGRVTHIVEIVRTQTTRHGATIERVDVDFRKALVDAANILRESITKRGIQLSIRCTNTPREVHVQASSFHQLMANLVKNAIDAIDEARRWRPEEKRGTIGVEARVDGHDLVIEVSDDGIGIEPENLGLIFQTGYTTKSDGMGLGLHSAANYLVGSGGVIEPLSAGIGKGTTIRVAWKLDALLSSATLASKRAAQRRRRIR